MFEQDDDEPISGDTLRADAYNAMQFVYRNNIGSICRRARKILRRAPKRTARIIAAIPKKIGQKAKPFLLNLQRSNQSFDCQASIMDLKAYEYSLSPGSYREADCHWEKRNPNPGQLRFAAKAVFDYCEKADLSPKVVRTTGRKCFRNVAYFSIQISWNVPVDMKSLRAWKLS